MNFRLISGAFVALAFFGCQHAPPAAATDEAPAWFRVETLNGRDERILTDVTIDGRTARLGLDTGAGAPFLLFATSVERLQLKVVRRPPTDAPPVPGRAQLGETAPCELQLFGQTLSATTFYFADLPAELSMEGDMDGAIGWPAVEGNTWALFLGRNQATVAPLEDYSRTEVAQWTKFSIAEGNTLSLKFAGEPHGLPRLIVDTGNSEGVMLPPPAWQKWNRDHPSAPKTIHGGYMPGQTLAATEVAWADELRIGPLVLHGVPVQEADAAYVLQAAPGEEIVALGLAALKRLDLIVDSKEHVAFAQASEFPPPPYRHNRIGAQFLPRDPASEDLVARVLASSPAGRAGLQEGDVLLTVNGWAVAGWRQRVAELDNHINMSAHAGTKWDFVVRRGDRIVHLTVVAENLLGPTMNGSK